MILIPSFEGLRWERLELLATKYDEERLAFLNSSFPTEAGVKSLDCALFYFKARKIRLEHEGSVGRSTRRSRLVATEHRYFVFF